MRERSRPLGYPVERHEDAASGVVAFKGPIRWLSCAGERRCGGVGVLQNEVHSATSDTMPSVCGAARVIPPRSPRQHATSIGAVLARRPLSGRLVHGVAMSRATAPRVFRRQRQWHSHAAIFGGTGTGHRDGHARAPCVFPQSGPHKPRLRSKRGRAGRQKP